VSASDMEKDSTEENVSFGLGKNKKQK